MERFIVAFSLGVGLDGGKWRPRRAVELSTFGAGSRDARGNHGPTLAICARLIFLAAWAPAHEHPQRLPLGLRQADVAASSRGRMPCTATGVEIAEDHLSHPTARHSWTVPQGQYLAYIYAYTVLNNGRPPAEADMQRFFQVTAPSVHRTVIELERKKLVARTPGAPRSLRVLVEPEMLPVEDR